MKYTGERVIPKLMRPSNGLLIEHLDRYRFAAPLAKGRVLDIACGVGYGAEVLLKKEAPLEAYVGVELSEEAIAYAKAHYGYEWTSYYVGDALDLSLVDRIGTFDTIISFETIEHFHGDALFIENLYTLLKPGGILIISTPFGQGVGMPCTTPFHVHQYKQEEFEALLSPFSNVTMYHQNNHFIERPRPGKKYYLMVAVCSK